MSQQTLDNIDATRQSRLLVLPTELRTVIWEMVADNELAYIRHNGTVALQPQLSYVNRQLRCEYLPIFHGTQLRGLVATIVDLNWLHLEHFLQHYDLEDPMGIRHRPVQAWYTRLACACGLDNCRGRPVSFSESGLPRFRLRVLFEFTMAFELLQTEYYGAWATVPLVPLSTLFENTSYALKGKPSVAEHCQTIWSQLHPFT
jgi:hypothetical protein